MPSSCRDLSPRDPSVTRTERGGVTPVPTILSTNVRASPMRRAPAFPNEVSSNVPYYEFIVKGDADVDVHALETETGLRCTPLDRAARLDGELIDQAALHGAIERVYRLGLDLMTVERRPSRHAT
jgi:hypothetical protein